MHGVGAYTGIDGTTYGGNWSMNATHGLEHKRYANLKVTKDHGSRMCRKDRVGRFGRMAISTLESG